MIVLILYALYIHFCEVRENNKRQSIPHCKNNRKNELKRKTDISTVVYAVIRGIELGMWLVNSHTCSVFIRVTILSEK